MDAGLCSICGEESFGTGQYQIFCSQVRLCCHYLVFYPAYSREELIKEIVSYEENFQQKVCPINTVVI